MFPNFGFGSKGPRIEGLINDIQLRPTNVLFIDDNPSNLEEARHIVPGLQTAGHDFVAGMLGDARLVGQADPDLVRLQQYKALQQRKADSVNADGVVYFLRASDIRVTVEHDVLAHLDRAIELINRTNQLNFTKARLSTDLETARTALRGLLASHDIQAGLLRVQDRYGDHGFAGFYVVQSGHHRLLHFCFSCRILGMGIETWLYHKLRRPHLSIQVSVLSDPITDRTTIDWIRIDGTAAASPPAAPQIDWMTARGGCDLAALTHYFGLTVKDVQAEFNVGRGGFDARIDHSMFLRCAIDGLPPDALTACAKLGYRPDDFRCALFRPQAGAGFWLLSFWIDSIYALYRHKTLGFLMPWAQPGEADHGRDARQASVNDLPPQHRTDGVAAALETLKRDYDYVGLIDEAQFKDNLRAILAKAPAGTPVVMLKRSELLDDLGGVRHVSGAARTFNLWMDDMAAGFYNVRTVSIRDHVNTSTEAPEWLHF